MEEIRTQFLYRSPLHDMRRIVERHLHHKTTPAEIEKLHRHPQMWLRVLYTMRDEVESHIAMRRAHLDGMKPPVLPEREYIAARAQFTQERTRRLNFRQRVITQISEVTALCGSNPLVDCKIIGDLAGALVEMSMHAELGDLEQVRNHAAHWAAVLAGAVAEREEKTC